MKVRFENPRVAVIETDRVHKLGLPVSVIASVRRKIQFIRQAVDERDLFAMKSLRYEKLKGKREGQRSMRLNDQWRLVVRIDEECKPLEIVVIEIVDYH